MHRNAIHIGDMVSSADVAILVKVAELAKRFGLRPSEAEAFVYLDKGENNPGQERERFVLDFIGEPVDPEINDKWERMTTLLGLEEGSSTLVGPELSDLEDAVDRALSLAPTPPARTR